MDGLTKWILNIIKDVDNKRKKHKEKYACKLLIKLEKDFSFDDGVTITPKYRRIKYVLSKRQDHPVNPIHGAISVHTTDTYKMQKARLDEISRPVAKVRAAKPVIIERNYSLASLSLSFFNDGTDALENVNINIVPDDKSVTFYDSDTNYRFLSTNRVKMDALFVSEKCVCKHIAIINPSEPLLLEMFFIHVPYDIGEFHLNWSMNSKTYRTEGMLNFKVEPLYKDELVENDKKVGTFEITDYKENITK